MVVDELTARPAAIRDITALAHLWEEGFGHEYGLRLPTHAALRLHERLLSLPSGLDDLTVIASPDDVLITMAGLRAEHRRSNGRDELRIAVEELGWLKTIGWGVWVQVYAPSNYRPKADEAYIYGVMVTTAWRGQGVGARLLDHLHDTARQAGKRRAVLGVMTTNERARRFYGRQGYVEVGTRSGLLTKLHISGPAQMVMHKALYP